MYRQRVPSARGYAATLTVIQTLVEECEHTLGLASRLAVGVGIPGAISRATGLVKNANSTHLIGHPLDKDLARELGCAVRVENDANCFALSEATDGAGTGSDVVFGVIAGTGVGAGIVAHGRALGGVNGIGGEWGHNPLPWPRDDERPGPQCYCGRRGCIETWLSGPSLTRDSGLELPAHEIVARPEGSAALERYIDRFARGLAHIINVLDPDVIVLGGGMSNVEALYAEIPKRWAQWIFSDTVETKLRKAVHGDSSGVRGAAWLC